MSRKENLSEKKMDIVEEKFKESMSGDNRGPNEVLAGSESNKDSKENCNPINEVESVVKLDKKSSKKGFFAPFKPPWKTDLNEKKVKKRKSKNRKSHCKVGCKPTTFKSKDTQLNDRKENEEKKVEKIVENEENVNPNGVFI